MSVNALIDVECEFLEHNAVIHTMCYNNRQKNFVSGDSSFLRLWKVSESSSLDGHSSRAKQLRQVRLSSQSNCYIQAIVYIESRDLYIASAQDGTFRMYDNTLEELTSIHTSRGHIQCLAFDTKHQLLIAGGLDGCTAWRVRDSVNNIGVNPLYDLARLDTYFKFPFRNLQALSFKSSDRLWIGSLEIDTVENRLFSLSKEHVEIFNTEDGRRIDTLSNFYAQDLGALSCLVLVQKTQNLVLGTTKGAILIVSIHPTAVLNVFREHGGAITSMLVHPGSSFLLSCSLDGSIRVWDVELRQHVHCLMTNERVYELGICGRSTSCVFYARYRNSIRVYRMESAVKELLSCFAHIGKIEQVSVSLLKSQEWNEGRKDHETLLLIIAADNTVHILNGERTRQEPMFTWIPNSDASDIIGVSLHPETAHLFLLHSNQSIGMIDIQKPNSSNTGQVIRWIDCSLKPGARDIVSVIPPSRPTERDIPSEIKSVRRTRDSFLFANPTFEGTIQCLCCLLFAPMMESYTRRPNWSNGTNDTPRSAHPHEMLHCTSHDPQALLVPRVIWEERRKAAVRAPLEWIVCGTSSGELVFWYTECKPEDCMRPGAIVKHIHKDPVTSIAASVATPSMVSCNTSHQYYIWHLQPLFKLKQIVSFQPASPYSCIGFSSISESMVAGYDDGMVLLIEYSELSEAVHDVACFQVVSDLSPADEDHNTTVVAVDFLDEKDIFITASADAILKIWSSQKTLLRQVMAAMVVSSLRFMNPRGDLLVAADNRAYTLIQDDIVPDHVRMMTLEQIGAGKVRRQRERKRDITIEKIDGMQQEVIDPCVPEIASVEEIADTAAPSPPASKNLRSFCMDHMNDHSKVLRTPILQQYNSLETQPGNADGMAKCTSPDRDCMVRRRLHIRDVGTESLAVDCS